MGKVFGSIKRGERFFIDGEPFVKTGDLTYDDMAGIERYIDPLQEAKIAVDGAKKEAKEPTTDEREWITDPATRVQSKNPNFGKKIKKPKAAKKTKKAAK
jgi:hypothetical protein